MWNKAIEFTVKVIDIVEDMDTNRKHYRLLEQVEASSASVPMNIAEGKGRYSKKVQSIYETMTLLEIFHRKKWIPNHAYSQLENLGIEIASMIKGLINSIR